MIHYVYMVKNNGDPLYGWSIEDAACVELTSLPSLVRNSVVMMQTSSSTSFERVYTLEMNECIWAYSFYHTFALVSQASKDQSISQLKNIMSSLGRAIAHQFGELIDAWSGSMSDIVDVNTLIDNYVGLNLNRPSSKILRVIDRLVNKALKQPELAIVGIFDSEGEMLRGNVPEVYMFRIQVEISQGIIKPVMDIAPTQISSGDHALQMLKVNSLTVVVASQPGESNLHAVSAVGEIAYTLNEKLS
jgi:hypothetical protein